MAQVHPEYDPVHRASIHGVWCDHPQKPRFFTQNTFTCLHCEELQHLRCSIDRRTVIISDRLCNKCFEESEQHRKEEKAANPKPATGALAAAGAPSASVGGPAVRDPALVSPRPPSALHLEGRSLLSPAEVNEAGVDVNGLTATETARVHEKAATKRTSSAKANADEADIDIALPTTQLTAKGTEATPDHRAPVAEERPGVRSSEPSTAAAERSISTPGIDTESLSANHKRSAAVERTIDSASSVPDNMRTTRAAERSKSEAEALQQNIRTLCEGAMWKTYCDLPGSDAPEAVREATKTEFNYTQACMVPVSKAPDSWVDEMALCIGKMLEASGTQKALELLKAQADVARPLKMWREEAVRLLHHGGFKRKREELGVLLEVLGLEEKGKFWKG